MKRRKSNIAAVALFTAILALTAYAPAYADSMRSPWEAKKDSYIIKLPKASVSNKRNMKRYETNPAKIPFLWGLKFYQKVISKIDGDKCGMYPTCSGYSARAIRKHGALIGLMMTADRLIHEGSELKRAPLVEKYGVIRYYDPLTNNDFWFTEKNDPS